MNGCQHDTVTMTEQCVDCGAVYIDHWTDVDMAVSLRRLVEACDRAEPYRAWFYLEWSWPRSRTGGGAWVARVEKHVGDGHTQFHGVTATEALDGARRMLDGAVPPITASRTTDK